MKRYFGLSIIVVVPLLLAQAAFSDVSEQSRKDVLKHFSYEVPSSSAKDVVSSTSSFKDDLGDVVRLEAFTVDERRDLKDFAAWMKDTDQRMAAEKFNWKDGGLISRRVGKRLRLRLAYGRMRRASG